MHFAFQDNDCIFLGLDYLGGGNLFYHLSKMSRFTEIQTSCIILALEYIHGSGVIHRNIKPANILLESSGYARLSGFGISKSWNPNDMYDTSGDPLYMAPEVLFRQNHSVAADFYSLGVLAYEFMLGKKPYEGSTRLEIREKIKEKQFIILKKDIPENWSLEAADFIFKCLQRKPSNRLGNEGATQAKKHPWFTKFKFDFAKLALKQVPAPFVPASDKSFDLNLFTSISEHVKSKDRAKKRRKVNILFKDYYFNRVDAAYDDAKKEVAIELQKSNKKTDSNEEEEKSTGRNIYVS